MDKNIDQFSKAFLDNMYDIYNTIKEKESCSDFWTLMMIQYTYKMFFEFAKINGYNGEDQFVVKLNNEG